MTAATLGNFVGTRTLMMNGGQRRTPYLLKESTEIETKGDPGVRWLTGQPAVNTG